MAEEVHVVDVRHAVSTALWVVYLSNGKVMHVSKYDHPDEINAFTYVTNRLKEQDNGTNSRT